MDIELEQQAGNEPAPRCVVRLVTTTWSTPRGVFYMRSLRYMKRHCRGCNIVQEDVSMIGSDDILQMFANFNTSPDGLYEVRIFNELRDWESGHLDSYEYYLTPFQPHAPQALG